MKEPYPWVLCAHCSWERALQHCNMMARIPGQKCRMDGKKLLENWERCFLLNTQYIIWNIKKEPWPVYPITALVCWFVQLSVWSNFLTDSCHVPTSPNSVGHGFHGEYLGASWALNFFVRVMKVFVVQRFGKHDLFWIDFSLGMIEILIFIQIKKLRHISQESRKYVFKPTCFTFWITSWRYFLASVLLQLHYSFTIWHS